VSAVSEPEKKAEIAIRIATAMKVVVSMVSAP
jgi:hypothetical protein